MDSLLSEKEAQMNWRSHNSILVLLPVKNIITVIIMLSSDVVDYEEYIT